MGLEPVFRIDESRQSCRPLTTMEHRPKAWRPTSQAMAKLQRLEHWQQQLTLCEHQIRTCERRLQQGIKALEAELYEHLISIPRIGEDGEALNSRY